MDPALIRVLPEIIGPFICLTILGGIPVALVYMSKHFKLRTRELELEAELHGRQSSARLQAIETRLSAVEGALSSLGQALSSPELSPGPDLPRLPQSRIGQKP